MHLAREATCRSWMKSPLARVRCVACEVEKPDADLDADLFRMWRAHMELARHITCKSCMTALLAHVRCVRCELERPQAEFDAELLRRRRSQRRVVRDARSQIAFPAGKDFLHPVQTERPRGGIRPGPCLHLAAEPGDEENGSVHRLLPK
ncbi:hypothetical protein N9L68_00350 [bacterium]|nr:hypothetical protein [bacterium]